MDTSVEGACGRWGGEGLYSTDYSCSGSLGLGCIYVMAGLLCGLGKRWE